MVKESLKSVQKSDRIVLTNTLVQKLEPRSSSSYDVRDSDLKGFMVRIFPSGTKTYRCEYKQGKHYTIGRANILTATQARQEAMKVLAMTAKGLDPNAEKRRLKNEELLQRRKTITFREFLENEYAPWYKATYPTTGQDNIKDIARHFLDDLGEIPLIQITQAHIEKWRIKRAKMGRSRIRDGCKVTEPISSATINRNMDRLSALFGKAVELGFLKSSPTAGIKKLKVEKPNRVRFLSEDEYRNLLEALNRREESIKASRQRANSWRSQRGYELYPDLDKQFFADHLKPMVMLALGSGIRFGSLVRLEWDKHVIFNQSHITICLTPDIVKTARGYEVPLDEGTSNIVYQWYQQNEACHQGIGWVFPGKVPGKHITTVKRAWKNLLREAGIENFTWHDQRHDFASQHVMSGTDLYTLMELLGHSDPKMTKRYAHLAAEHKLAAAKQLAKRRGEIVNKREDG